MEPKQTKEEEDQQNKIPKTTNQTPSLRLQHHPSPPAVSQTETLTPVVKPSTEPLKKPTNPSPSPSSQRRSPPSPPHDSPLHSPSSSDDNRPQPQPTAAPAEYHTSPLSESPLHSPSSSGKSSPRVPEPTPAVKHPAPAPAVAQFPPPRPRRHYKPPSPAAEESPLHSLSPDSVSAKPSPALSQYVPEKAIVVSEGFSTVEVSGSDDLGIGGGGVNGGGRKRVRPELSILRRARRETMVHRASLAFRVCGLVLCLVSFSVMAANRHEGWALDSFYRYKEFRYCITVNVVGFVYAGLQAFDSAYFLATGKRLAQHRLRCYLDFSLDQILSYLLISSSSSAATRVDDWQSNWGKDVFTEMASASVGLSFVAFGAFAFSSLISGYNLCTLNSI